MSLEILLETGTFERLLDQPIQFKDLRRYAWASGDYNPIHYDKEVASHMGLKSPIAHGMYCMGVLHRSLIEVVGSKNYKVKEWDARFMSMVPVESSCKVSFKLISKNVDQIKIEIALTIISESGLAESPACRAKVVLKAN